MGSGENTCPCQVAEEVRGQRKDIVEHLGKERGGPNWNEEKKKKVISVLKN